MSIQNIKFAMLINSNKKNTDKIQRRKNINLHRKFRKKDKNMNYKFVHRSTDVVNWFRHERYYSSLMIMQKKAISYNKLKSVLT